MLPSLEEWRTLPGDARRSAAERVARTSGLRLTGRFVGAAELPELERDGGMLFVAVPGGRFRMGFSPDEMQRLLVEADVAPGRPGSDHWRPRFEAAYERARPVRDVVVAPFLCARAPLLDVELVTVEPAAVAIREPFPDARPTRAVASFLRPDAAARVVAKSHARLPSEAEWEWIAREGGGSQAKRSYAAWRRPTEDLYAKPGFAPRALLTVDEEDAEFREEIEASQEQWLGQGTHGLGIWGLAFGEWVADRWHESYAGAPSDARAWDPAAVPEMHRGGSVLHFPWQDRAEVMTAHPAWRAKGAPYGGLGAARLVLDLPVGV